MDEESFEDVTIEGFENVKQRLEKLEIESNLQRKRLLSWTQKVSESLTNEAELMLGLKKVEDATKENKATLALQHVTLGLIGRTLIKVGMILSGKGNWSKNALMTLIKPIAEKLIALGLMKKDEKK